MVGISVSSLPDDLVTTASPWCSWIFDPSLEVQFQRYIELFHGSKVGGPISINIPTSGGLSEPTGWVVLSFAI
jgi:hypothetical protein